MLRSTVSGLLLAVGLAAGSWPISCNSTQTAQQLLAGRRIDGDRPWLVTGADGHIAGQLTLALAKANGSLVLACHNPVHCTAAQQALVNATGNRREKGVD